MIKKKTNYEVTTKAKCLEDVDGSTAFTTFKGEDKVYSNDYIFPFHAICEQKVKISTEEVEVDDPTCQNGDVPPVPPTPGEPHIDGANNTSIPQGTDFDLTEGVTAYDGDGNEIPFTVTPQEVQKCEVGEQVFTYNADGVTKNRTITVTQIANPTISGLSELTVDVGEEFDPLDGVSAVDGNGNEVEVTVEQPSEEWVTIFEGVVASEQVDVTIPAKADTWKRIKVIYNNVQIADVARSDMQIVAEDIYACPTTYGDVEYYLITENGAIVRIDTSGATLETSVISILIDE